ncbi:MAG: TauD/TfdA family dioxygenase [Gammaproteobacteria bacterium]|nr:TauD/TfdA family dioxygenase [Gammaproteobacteria bacterium]MDH3857647.1 TauD/TfdA family dioxygenase [Gammaproteobacteria bacterium]
MSKSLFLEDLVVDFSGSGRTEAIAEVHRKLDVERAALLRNTGMTRLSEMATWAELLDLQPMDYTGGTGHRKPMGAGVLSVGIEPHYTNIEPHCEMSFWTYYPRYILFGCVEIPSTGGETVIADNRRVTEEVWVMKTGQRIFEKGIRYIRNFADANSPACIPSTKSWQEAFEISDWGELEDFCEDKDWQLLRREDGSVQVSYSEVGFEYDPRTGTNLLFTSMARLGRAFDNWPPYNSLPNDQRPYHVTYADGSEFSSEDLDTLDRIFARHSIPIPWQPGDIAVLDNITWPHARPPYQLQRGEQRRIGVLVSEPIQRQRIVMPSDN